MAEKEPISRGGNVLENSEIIEQIVNRAVKEAVDKDRKAEAAKRAELDRRTNTIDLFELFYRLVENLQMVIILAVLGAVLGGVYARFFTGPLYSATSKLYVVENHTDGTAITQSDLTVGATLANDYTEVFKTWEIHDAVRKALDLDYTNSQLQSMLSVSVPNDTRIVYINIRCSDQQKAADIANAYADAAKEFIEKNMQTLDPSIFSTATVPKNSIANGPFYYIFLGFVAGAMMSVVIVTIFLLLDDRPRSSEDVAKYAGVPTLTVIPATRKVKTAKEGKRR